MTEPRRLRFSAIDATIAYDAWRFNCGPGALAAILGLTPHEVRPLMGDFENKGYTNPTLMLAALKRARIPFSMKMMEGSFAAREDAFPDHGLVRIQWEGPWTQPGVPIAARYRHTHWIGTCRAERPVGSGNLSLGVFDINAMGSGGWTTFEAWRDTLVPWLLKQCVPRASGSWHVTHAIEVEAPPTDGAS